MPKIKQVKVNKSGWSRWEAPKMQGYLMACCDCGLVHEMEFQALSNVTVNKQGWVKGEEVKDARVLFRARRYVDPTTVT